MTGFRCEDCGYTVPTFLFWIADAPTGTPYASFTCPNCSTFTLRRVEFGATKEHSNA